MPAFVRNPNSPLILLWTYIEYKVRNWHRTALLIVFKNQSNIHSSPRKVIGIILGNRNTTINNRFSIAAYIRAYPFLERPISLWIKSLSYNLNIRQVSTQIGESRCCTFGKALLRNKNSALQSSNPIEMRQYLPSSAHRRDKDIYNLLIERLHPGRFFLALIWWFKTSIIVKYKSVVTWPN